MMDQFDRAQELEIAEREAAIRRQRQKLREAKNVGIALQCMDCGGDIPLARRSAMPGAVLCVDCQQINEQKQRGYKK